MINAEVGLFVFAALLALAVWYINTHSEERPRYKRKRRRTEPAKKAPAYERENGPLTAKQIKAIKKLVPQGRMKKVKSSLF